jgi:hypothetical protein
MKELIQKLSPFLKDKTIIDIIIFGSITKSKKLPEDIDIAILMNTKEYTIVEKIKSLIPKADVQIITIEDFQKKIFLTLIKEGYSIRNKKYLYESYNIAPVKLYRYDLRQLSLSKKVMFERGIKSIQKIEKLSNRVVLVPIQFSERFEQFLKQWNLDIDTKEYELLPLMRKEEL